MNKLSILFKKVYSSKYVSITMIGLFLIELFMMFAFASYWIEVPSRVFHISTELICMAVLIVLYRLYFSKIDIDKKSEKQFVILCILL